MFISFILLETIGISISLFSGFMLSRMIARYGIDILINRWFVKIQTPLGNYSVGRPVFSK